MSEDSRGGPSPGRKDEESDSFRVANLDGLLCCMWSPAWRSISILLF